MANELYFKRGTQANLNALTTSDEGTFYLTTDSHRLYVGTGSGKKPALLNQTVQIANSVNALKSLTGVAENDFYYAKNENILCVYTNGGWVQINPDTCTNTKVENATFSAGVYNSTNNTVTYTLTFNNNAYDEKGGLISDESAVVSVPLVLDSAVIANLVPEKAEVSLEADTNAQGIEINTAGAGSDSNADGITLKSSGPISVELNNDKDEITIKGHSPNLSVTAGADNAVDVKLTDSKSSTTISTVTYNAGQDLNIEQNNSKITYSHKTYNAPTKNSAGDTGDIEYISDITVSNGHITGYTTQTYKDKYVNSGVTYGTEYLSVDVEDFEDLEEDLDIGIRFTEQATGGSFKVSLLDYTSGVIGHLDKNYIQPLSSTVNALSSALQYKGIAGTTTTVSDPKAGYVYMASENGTILNVPNVKRGDLLIYAEGEDGSKKWELIPSGDDLNTDTQYSAEASFTNKKYTYQLKNETNAGYVGDSLEIVGDNNFIELENKTTDINKAPSVQINHKAKTVNKTDSNKTTPGALSYISSLTLDGNHITGYTQETMPMREYELTVDAGNKGIALVDQHTSGKDVVKISSNEALEIEYTNGTTPEITINHKEKELTGTTATNNLAFGNTFTAITNATTDDYGHLSQYTATTYTLPAAHVYKLIGNSTNKTITLKNDTTGDTTGGTIKFTSSNFSVGVSGTTTNVSLVWDTF